MHRSQEHSELIELAKKTKAKLKGMVDGNGRYFKMYEMPVVSQCAKGRLRIRYDYSDKPYVPNYYFSWGGSRFYPIKALPEKGSGAGVKYRYNELKKMIQAGVKYERAKERQRHQAEVRLAEYRRPQGDRGGRKEVSSAKEKA